LYILKSALRPQPVVVAYRDGQPIFIRDLGKAVDDAAIQSNIVRVNGNRSVYVPLLREPGENTIQVVDRIREGIATEVPKMKERGDIPQATQIDLVSDQSEYIREAIANLQTQVLLGGVLVLIVVIGFLRNIRASLAVLILLPLALLSGILGFYFTGETINVMTLGGLALAVGTVVDAGIVVVENTIRHRRMGKDSITAAMDAADEVSIPILSGTITTLVAFIPAIFLSGMVKFLFVPLALAAVLTIGASYVIAMTVVPAVCSRFLGDPRKAQQGDPEADQLQHGVFSRLIGKSIKGRWLSVAAIGGACIGSLALFPLLGTELFPEVDAGTFEVRIKTTPGTRIEKTEDLIIAIEDSIRDTISSDNIQTIISNIGMPVGKGAGFSTILSSNSGPDTAYGDFD